MKPNRSEDRQRKQRKNGAKGNGIECYAVAERARAEARQHATWFTNSLLSINYY